MMVAVAGAQEAAPYRYPNYPPASSTAAPPDTSITLGIMYPKSIFRKKYYEKVISDAMFSVTKLDLKFMENFKLVNSTISMEINPSPTFILNSLCERFLPENVSAIIFLSCTENYGRATASAQYFLQLAGYLGIPVIAWNADNSGLEQAAQTGLRIQLAPSVHHQAAAMLSILVRYQWHSLSIVTSQIAGHTDFVQAVRDQVASHQEQHRAKFVIIDTIVIDDVRKSLIRLKNSEARIVLLYSTKEEATAIMGQAKKLGLVDKDYMWIVTQSVVGDRMSKELPVGMLGVHFDTSMDSLTSSILTAVEVFAYAIEEFVNQTRFRNGDQYPRLSCNDHRNSKWALGSTFYRHLREVTIPKEPTTLSFNGDGTRQDVELKIVNLRDSTTNSKIWEEIGVWRSWEEEGLSVNDIVWPGNGHVPPQGVPEKFELRIVFLEESPYINLAPADPITHQCSANSGVPCRVPPSPESRAANNITSQTMCCSGFCIDLLEKFAADLGFTYELVRVDDGKWGTMDKDHRWNGLIGDLLRRDGLGAEMALTSLKINKERESVVDFTVPFLESGIAIVVAKRTGIISPTAFLEPFDTASWMLVAFVAIQVAALTIFLFEWLSPGGYNMRMAPPRDHKFSLFRTYWLVWAVLFQAAVHVDCPRGFTARFMANMWAMFAVVFLAIYTANLAAFMITREEFHDFSGHNDPGLSMGGLQYPSSVSPAYKFGTVEETNSAMVLRRHQRHMYNYMVRHGYNRPAVQEGVRSIKKNELDAFIYDATVLDYLVGQDDDCQILTVGSWYSMSGYGLAFPRGSKYLPLFNNKLMTYKDNGEIERLQRFWMTGTCKPMKQQRRASEPLAIEQFLSAYLLLGIGMVLAVVLLGLEHIYFKYVRKHLAKKDSGGCCALVSLSMGKSLTFRGAVYEATTKLRRHRCRDPLCDTHIWRVKHELDMARVTIRHLEKQLEASGHKLIHKKPPQHVQSGVGGAPLLGCCWSSPPEEHTWVRPAALPVTSSQQHLLQTSQGAQGATPGEGIASIQEGGGGGGVYRRHNPSTLYMETVLSEAPGGGMGGGGGLGGHGEDLAPHSAPHPQLSRPHLPIQAAPSPLLPQTVLPNTPRKRSFESRSPDSPLAGLIRCQHQLK
ncbi:glutamate receptor ionotropic, NMDA 2B-like [Eriocheir sinensis]|uniref:glutamate receptor ionotropic, NMDA 2B-like n=1 Tax=Eriocheir sinensis TaxID=95602 RepID=UPI0021C7B3B8|nr:glutamate receptor ionotropic, NMDA 2B-like [Eriocheir sinensis]